MKDQTLWAWLTEEFKRPEFRGEICWESTAIDLSKSRWSVSYLRQELRRRGYLTKLSGKNSRWLMAYKK